jgi:RNase adaptor protein for sRNA GlmZ degradation
MRIVDMTVFHLLNTGAREVVLHTYSVAGTHRGVAAAELIADALQAKGVKTVHVTHVHRNKGWAEVA